MFLRENGFEVTDDGISIEGGPHIIGGAASPLSLTPTSSTIYVQSNGEVWTHDGVGPWKKVGADNFSIKKILSGETKEVPQNHQMLLTGALVNFGQFNNFGEVILLDIEDSDTAQVIPPADPENFSHAQILNNQTKVIPQGQQMNVFGMIQNFGELQVLGELNVTKIYEKPSGPQQFVDAKNFSYREIQSGETLEVPARQQMSVSGVFKNFGTFVLKGQLVLEDVSVDFQDDALPPWKIDADETYSVHKNRVLQCPRMLVNLGTIKNNGLIYLGG
jgi:hypothetical protein